jgi:hypothetical protein
MAFRGRDRTRSEIVINNKIIEQVNTLNYLGNLVSYEREKVIDKIIKNCKDNSNNQQHIQTKQSPKRYINKIVYYIGSSSITIWEQNMDSKIKRQIQTDSSRNEVYAKD